MSQNVIKKRLLYLSKYRGCRESEILFSSFSTKYLDTMTSEELFDYEEILCCTDSQLMDWLIKNFPLPDSLQNNILITKLKDFNNYR